MAYSLINYTGDGSTTDFLFDKPYTTAADVLAYVDTVLTAITWVDSTHVRFTPAPVAAAVILLKRTSEVSSPLFTFPDLTYLKSTNLDGNSTQQLYLHQEALDDREILHTNTILTAADVETTNANVVLTNADVVLTHADVVSTNANVVLTNADVVTTAAVKTNLRATWYLPRATETNLDDNGDASTAGDTYFNTTLNKNRVYNGTSWADTGNGSVDANTINISDAGGFLTATEVEAALQEIAAIPLPWSLSFTSAPSTINTNHPGTMWATKVSTGIWNVNHGIGSTAYVALATPANVGDYALSFTALNTTSIQVQMRLAGVLADAAVNVLLIPS